MPHMEPASLDFDRLRRRIPAHLRNDSRNVVCCIHETPVLSRHPLSIWQQLGNLLQADDSSLLDFQDAVRWLNQQQVAYYTHYALSTVLTPILRLAVVLVVLPGNDAVMLKIAAPHVQVLPQPERRARPARRRRAG